MQALRARVVALPAEVRGAACLILACALFAVMDATAKGLMQRYDPFQVVWARYLGQALIVLAIVSPRLGTVARSSRPALQAFRSALLFCSTLCGFFAFSVMPLAEAVAIFQTAPLMIVALAALVLRERVGPRRWAGVAFGFLGALVIVRPGAETFQPAALLPMVGALTFAGYSIATRFLGRDDSLATTFLYTAALGAVAASLFVPMVWVTPTPRDALIMLSMGFVGSAGQFMLIAAFNTAPASAIAPFTYAGLIFSALAGYAAFGERPDLWTVVGAAMIAGAGVYIWMRERALAAR